MSHGGFADRGALADAARRWLLAGWRDADSGRLRELVSPDFRYDLAGRDGEVGFDWYLGFLELVHGAIEDLEVEILATVVDGDDVAVHMVLRGRQTGPLFGIAARGATGAIDAMTRLEFREARVVRQSSITDFARLQSVLKGSTARG